MIEGTSPRWARMNSLRTTTTDPDKLVYVISTTSTVVDFGLVNADVYVISPVGLTVTSPYSGAFVITIGDAGGSGNVCGGTTVGVFGSTKINFFGSSTGGGVGRTGGINAGGVGVGSGDAVAVGDAVGRGVPVGVGEVTGDGVTEPLVVGVGDGDGDGVSVIPCGVGDGVGKAFGFEVGRI